MNGQSPDCLNCFVLVCETLYGFLSHRTKESSKLVAIIRQWRLVRGAGMSLFCLKIKELKTK